MNETNITEKITNIIKRGNVFDKIKKVEKLVYGCVILVTVFGISIIINEFCNTQLLLEQRENLKKIIRKQNDELEKMNKLIEMNARLMNMLFESKI